MRACAYCIPLRLLTQALYNRCGKMPSMRHTFRLNANHIHNSIFLAYYTNGEVVGIVINRRTHTCMHTRDVATKEFRGT